MAEGAIAEKIKNIINTYGYKNYGNLYDENLSTLIFDNIAEYEEIATNVVRTVRGELLSLSQFVEFKKFTSNELKIYFNQLMGNTLILSPEIKDLMASEKVDEHNQYICHDYYHYLYHDKRSILMNYIIPLLPCQDENIYLIYRQEYKNIFMCHSVSEVGVYTDEKIIDVIPQF